MISSKHIAQATYSLFTAHPERVSDISDKLLQFVATYHLEMQLPTILEYIKREDKKYTKTHSLLVHSPCIVDTETLSHIKKYIGVHGDVQTNVSLKPALIGGFLAYWKDTKIDGSIAHTLERLRGTLVADY